MRGSVTGAFVRKTGDTMTGGLTISGNLSPSIVIDRPDGLTHRSVEFRHGGVMRYAFVHQAAEPEFLVLDGAAAAAFSLRMDNHLLGDGLLPLSMLRVDDQFVSNGGIITVLAAATSIVNTVQVTVAAGDRILVTGSAAFAKGGTAGISAIFATQLAGTATVVGEASDPSPGDSLSQANGITLTLRTATIMRVTVGGTLQISLSGTSAGSNSTVAAGLGQLETLVLRG